MLAKRSCKMIVLTNVHNKIGIRLSVVCRFFSATSNEVVNPLSKIQRIVSGIQPTGSLHLGNYLGAIKKWVELQNSGDEAFYSIADLHALTVPQDPLRLKRGILDMTASLIACGVDPEKCILFQQSQVHYHTQLCWILAGQTTMAKLGQQAQLREKKQIMPELSPALYLYPVLQAADILLYRASLVPVGEDQISHLNLASFLARAFNKRYGNTFVVPKPLINEDASRRLKSLRNPSNKMSKSDHDPRSRINLCDSPDEILIKCQKAVTDCTSAVTYEPEKRPGISNLLVIHSALTGKSIDDICKEMENVQTGDYKVLMASEIIAALTPIRQKFEQLSKEPAYLEKVLQAGASRAQSEAQGTWQEVINRIGTGPCVELRI